MPTWAERIATPGFTLSNSSPTILMTGGSFGSIVMDDGDAQVLRLLAEFFFRILGDEVHRHKAELIAAGLRAKDVFEVLVRDHGRGNAGGDPHEILQLLDAGGHRHALRR